MGIYSNRFGYNVVKIACMIVMLYAHVGDSKCEFKGIFNFGDSNSDTGGFWAAFPAQGGPYGMTFFKKPAGRASDGRLVIDFLAQGIGLPFISPYLQSIGSDFRHGANYATLASTVLLPNTSLFVTGISPFSLAIQLNQLKYFKVKVDEHHSSHIKGLPRPDIFKKSIYTFYIGQNDFTSNIGSGLEAVKQNLPQVIGQIVGTIKEIYGIGGRTFMVMNLAPVGCYPSILSNLGRNNKSDIDKFGCLTSVNDAVQYYNKLLEQALRDSRAQLKKATIVYLDTNNVLLSLFRDPKSFDMRHGTRACCGYGGGPYNFDNSLFCGNTKVLNGRNATAAACTDPQNYVSFDGIHTTEAANRHISAAILNGSISYPSFSLSKLCHG